MKRLILLTIAMVLIGAALLWYGGHSGKKTIAIVVTLSHPALETVQSAFTTIATAAFDDSIDIVTYNAEGSMQQANLIAQKIASDKDVVGILAIGTLAAQTIAKAEKKRPIIFAAVSDPTILGKTSANVCGLSDGISAQHQIESMMKLLPHIKRVALLYSPSEANSVSMVNGLATELDARRIAYTRAGVHESQQITAASIHACTQSDVVIIPLDNQLVAAMPSVIRATRTLPCLIMASNESPIHQGAALAFGIDYQKSGEEAGHLMTKLLAHELTPEQIGFVLPKHLDIFVNDAVLKEKRITLNEETIGHIIHVRGERNG